MPKPDLDIISDVLRRVQQAVERDGGFSDVLAAQIEVQIRRDWGGTDPYIPKATYERVAERNEKIYHLFWDEGKKDIGELSRRFGLTRRTIQRIVYGEKK